MLINLIPEFLAILAAGDPLEAYRRYLDRHSLVLHAYWHNYILDLDSPHAEDVIRRATTANRGDLHALLDQVDVERLARDTAARCHDMFEMELPFDVYLMIGVGGANAGELVIGGRGIAFVCLEHFTGRPNPESLGLGLRPEVLSLWLAHELAHLTRYTSPYSQSELAAIVRSMNGYYDCWEAGSRATLRELMMNEGLAVAASRAAVPGFEPWDYLGYQRRAYRRLRQLDAFLTRAVAPDLEQRGLGYRLRYLSGGIPPAQRVVAGKVIPERSGYYLGHRMVEPLVNERGIGAALRAPEDESLNVASFEDGAQSA